MTSQHNGRDTAKRGTGQMTALRAPILGEKAKLALRTDAGGHKRRKLLVLLAAYADAGERPTVNALSARLGIQIRQTDALLKALEHQGLIRVKWAPQKSWRRNEYELLFVDDDGRDAAREEGIA